MGKFVILILNLRIEAKNNQTEISSILSKATE